MDSNLVIQQLQQELVKFQILRLGQGQNIIYRLLKMLDKIIDHFSEVLHQMEDQIQEITGIISILWGQFHSVLHHKVPQLVEVEQENKVKRD